MSGSKRWTERFAAVPQPEGAEGRQLNLFSAGGFPPASPSVPSATREVKPPGELDDTELIAAIPAAGIADAPALVMEAGRRGLAAAVPALEELARRFAGFGVERTIPEQVAALEALAMIGSREAARAVARLLAKGAVQGPALKVAAAAAARLGSDLPARFVLGLMRHPDPAVRSDACRCVHAWSQAIPLLVGLLDDPNVNVSEAAACALGRLGRREALPALARLLRERPSREVIGALTPIADEDCVVLLARTVRAAPHLADAALDALETIDHPRAAQLLAGLLERPS